MFGSKNVLTNVAKTNEHSNITTLFCSCPIYITWSALYNVVTIICKYVYAIIYMTYVERLKFIIFIL